MTDDVRGVRLPPSHDASVDHHSFSDGGQPDPHWIRVATCDQIPPRQGRSVAIGDRELAIFNLGPTELGGGDRFLAVDNQCPHKAGPLADGIVTGTSVVCPLHTWKINLVHGCVERPQAAGEQCVATYAVRVEEGVVAVSVPR
jgi:nitrite reductase (NADH) small subunit